MFMISPEDASDLLLRPKAEWTSKTTRKMIPSVGFSDSGQSLLSHGLN